MVRINWTKIALEDLRHIFDYISYDSIRYAKIQVVNIRDKTKILKQSPYACKVVTELNKQNIRELIEGNYRIIYKIVDEERIDILAIHHGARDFLRRIIS